MSSVSAAGKVIARLCGCNRKLNDFRSFSLHQSSRIDEQKQQRVETKRKEIMSRGLPKRKPLKDVKQILMVASGKGGVGKSTTAVNLATALKIINPEKLIGLLDADVFGPSIPLMMNIDESPIVNQENLMEPLVNYGIKCMSMGFLIEEKSSVVWRGLMVMSAIEKLLYQVAWGPLDYLVIDTPPGTGDTQLSILQNLPIAGVLLVTTPQKPALEVTRRGAAMFQKLNVPIAGILENMSSISCPKCSNEIALFGDGTNAIARELGIEVVQRIPLSNDVMESGDTGKPVVLSMPKSLQAEAYKELAKRMMTFLDGQPISR